jgi:O-glycosyl hydrolase
VTVGAPTGSLWRRLTRRAWLARVSAGAAVALSLLGLSSLVVPSLDTDAAPAGAAVSSDSGQQIQGFGASGAWWPNDLQHFSAAGQDHVASLLFDPSGLGLSQYRYNIGGGGVGVTTPEKTAPTFFAGPGNYDWSADPGGVGFLMMAAQHGVRTLVGFVNSAPVAWTTSDKSCGGALVPASQAAFATYLSTVVAHLHDVDHVTLSYVSPMNEPDASQPTCRQEGMVVPVGQRAGLVKAVASALNKRAPYAHVIADESSLVASQLLPEAPRWLSVPGAASSVAAIAHHTYDYPPMPVLHQVAQLGGQFHKPLWASEICCRNNRGFGYQFDPTMASGLWLANTIWADLTQAHDSAFDWWTALSPRIGCNPVADPSCTTRVNPLGRNDGLLYYDAAATVDQNETIYPTKRYWALGNFSRYVRPGAVLHNVTGAPPGTRAAAFSSKSGWSVVVIDDTPAGTPPTPLSLHIPNGGHTLSPVTAVQTSDTLNLDPVPLPRYRGGTMSASVAPHSVTTYVLNNVPSGRRQTTAALRQPGRGANQTSGRGTLVQTRRTARA